MKLNVKISGQQAVIRIEDDIDADYGFNDQGFAQLLAAFQNAQEITLQINSWGGDPRVAMRIVDLMGLSHARFSADIIDVCASSATLIAMACEGKVKMASNGMYGIHNARALADTFLQSNQLRSLADMVDEINDQFVAAYTRKTKKKEDEIRGMMDAETLMSAQEALAAGFIDEVYEPAVEVPRYVTVAAKIFGQTESTDAGSVINHNDKNKTTMDKTVWEKIKAKFGWGGDDLEALVQANADHDKLSRLQQLEGDIATLRGKIEALESEKLQLQAKLQKFESDETAAFEAKVKAEVDTAIAEFRISASQREAWEAKLKADFEGTKALFPEKDALKPRGVQKRSSGVQTSARINPTVAKHLGLN